MSGKRLGRFIDVPLNRIRIIAGIISLIVTGAGGGLKLGLSFGSRERSVIVPWLCDRSRIVVRLVQIECESVWWGVSS